MVTLKNFGLLSLVSATVNWEVNGVLQTPVTFGGTIGNLADTMLSLGSYSFLANTPYTIKIWSSSPNGVTTYRNNYDDGRYIFQGTPTEYGYDLQFRTYYDDAAVVPIPGAVWLLGSGILGLVGLRKRKNS